MLTVAGVVEDVSRRLGVEPPIYRRRMDFFWSDSEFDTARARGALDWAPQVDLPEGIRRTLEDYRSTGALAA
jgi:nucleoside-diphosphate-sugar epimerase